jgi:anti-anti-sigma factor
MKLKLVEIENGFVRVATEGPLTSADMSSSQDQHPLEALLGQHWSNKKVLLDFDKTTYIDSSAIGWLINCQRKFKDGGGMLVLHSIPPTVLQILNVLKIGKLIPLERDLSTARDIALNGAAGVK